MAAILNFNSGAPAAREGPPSGAPQSSRKEKENLMVIMASGIARGRVRTTTTTTTESRNMAAILQKIGCTVYFFDIGHPVL